MNKKLILYTAILSAATVCTAKEHLIKLKCPAPVIAVDVTLQHPTPKDTAKLKEIIDKTDKLHRSKTSKAVIEMEIITANWSRKLKMRAFSENLDKTFIHVLEPVREKDTKTLRIKNQMWNYLPKAAKVMKIPPSMMMSSWMGSDFTNDDLVKESTLTHDYNARWFLPQNPHNECYYIALIPKKETISLWDKITLTVDKTTLLPVQEVYYDKRKGPMRALYFKDVKKLGGRIIPAVMEMKPLKKKSNKTVIKYLDALFDIDLDKNTFTLQNLQKL
jgi:outer membrane lipoprotein-sorting protein